ALTGVTIQLKASQHRTILPVLTVTSLGLIVWNACLLARFDRVSQALRRRRGLVLVDLVLMGLILTFEGGMGSPWQPLAFGSILVAGAILGGRAAGLTAAAYCAGLLAGYGLMRALPVDDAGTLAQDMPLAWFFDSVVFATVAACSTGIGWMFARVD